MSQNKLIRSFGLFQICCNEVVGAWRYKANTLHVRCPSMSKYIRLLVIHTIKIIETKESSVLHRKQTQFQCENFLISISFSHGHVSVQMSSSTDLCRASNCGGGRGGAGGGRGARAGRGLLHCCLFCTRFSPKLSLWQNMFKILSLCVARVCVWIVEFFLLLFLNVCE